MKIAAIQESYLNASEGYRIHDQVTPIKETYFDEDITPGELYRELQKEHGRCQSKVYVSADAEGSVNFHIGWVFVKRMKYDDCNETYLQETWITLLSEYDPRPRMKYLHLGTD
jgi:hypothetical protein